MEYQRKPLVAGNWKMNGSRELVSSMSTALTSINESLIDVVVCPPSPYLSCFGNVKFSLAAQNLSQYDNGAQTGEVSTDMLVDLKCKYVIIGHSERRENYGDTDAVVAKKVKKALKAGLTPILCVGESLQIREEGKVFDFVKQQLKAVADEVGDSLASECVIAYEPIWAIGTGKTASAEQAQEVHAFIRTFLATLDNSASQQTKLLYGGSVKPENARVLFAQPDIDGGLIGGASLNELDFIAICQAAS